MAKIKLLMLFVCAVYVVFSYALRKKKRVQIHKSTPLLSIFSLKLNQRLVVKTLGWG